MLLHPIALTLPHHCQFLLFPPHVCKPGSHACDIFLRDSISAVIEESGEECDAPNVSVLDAASGAVGGGMVAKELRVEHKRFFFDVGSNQRGTFLRISGYQPLPAVKPSCRSLLTSFHERH